MMFFKNIKNTLQFAGGKKGIISTQLLEEYKREEKGFKYIVVVVVVVACVGFYFYISQGSKMSHRQLFD